VQSVLVTVQAVQMEKSSCEAAYNDTWLICAVSADVPRETLYSNNITVHPGLLSVRPDRLEMPIEICSESL
jgi:hypothetical protein